MNQVILIGQVGNKPNLFENGDRPVATFLVFTDWVNARGERIGVRHQIRCWRNADGVAARLEAGDTVLVQGALDYYERPDGTRDAYVLAWQVRLLRRKALQAQEETAVLEEAPAPPPAAPAKTSRRKGKTSEAHLSLDDALPF